MQLPLPGQGGGEGLAGEALGGGGGHKGQQEGSSHGE